MLCFAIQQQADIAEVRHWGHGVQDVGARCDYAPGKFNVGRIKVQRSHLMVIATQPIAESCCRHLLQHRKEKDVVRHTKYRIVTPHRANRLHASGSHEKLETQRAGDISIRVLDVDVGR